MNCCNHNCRQGRDCPNQGRDLPITLLEPEPVWCRIVGAILGFAAFCFIAGAVGHYYGVL